ncbi:MAG: lysophospholipid acyltransferase family protein [Devosia sp.]
MSETAGGVEKPGLKDHPFVRWLTGAVLIGGYLRLIKLTSKVVADPPDWWERVQADWPVIGVSWHGQSNLAYACIPETKNLALLISNHPDGRMAAAVARSFGYRTVDGSGASERQGQGTGGLTAFRNMLKALKSGTTLFATANIPPIPDRNVSLGMIALARRSGRPVFAIATASSRRKVLDRVWDKMQINYPFSTIAFAAEGPLWMTDEKVTNEAYAAQLKGMLDRALERAFAIADAGK